MFPAPLSSQQMYCEIRNSQPVALWPEAMELSRTLGASVRLNRIIEQGVARVGQTEACNDVTTQMDESDTTQ